MAGVKGLIDSGPGATAWREREVEGVDVVRDGFGKARGDVFPSPARTNRRGRNRISTRYRKNRLVPPNRRVIMRGDKFMMCHIFSKGIVVATTESTYRIRRVFQSKTRSNPPQLQLPELDILCQLLPTNTD